MSMNELLHDIQPRAIKIEGELTIYTAMDVKRKFVDSSSLSLGSVSP